MTLLADLISGDTAITASLGLLVLAGFGAYIAEKVSTQHRVAASERVSEKQQVVIERHEAEIIALKGQNKDLENALNIIRERLPPRDQRSGSTGSWAAVERDGR